MGKHNINTEYKKKTETNTQRPTQFLKLGHLAGMRGNTDKRFPEQDYTSYSYSSDALVVLARQPIRALLPTLQNGVGLLELPLLWLFAYYTYNDKTLK